MTMLRLVIGLVAFVVPLCAVGSAQGDPLNGNTLIITLYNCTGPAGTPSTFQGTKTLSGANSLHLLDGTGNFVRRSYLDTVTGLSITWGPGDATKPTVTCNTVSAETGHVAVVTGYFTPVGDGGS